MTDFLPLFSQDVSCMRYSAIRRMAKLAMQPGIIGFAAGTPSVRKLSNITTLCAAAAAMVAQITEIAVS